MSARGQDAVEDALVGGLVMLVAALTFLAALTGLSQVALLVVDRDPAPPVAVSLAVVLVVVGAAAAIAIAARRATYVAFVRRGWL